MWKNKGDAGGDDPQDCVVLSKSGPSDTSWDWSDFFCDKAEYFVCNSNNTHTTTSPTVDPTDNPSLYPTESTSDPSLSPTIYPTAEPTDLLDTCGGSCNYQRQFCINGECKSLDAVSKHGYQYKIYWSSIFILLGAFSLCT